MSNDREKLRQRISRAALRTLLIVAFLTGMMTSVRSSWAQTRRQQTSVRSDVLVVRISTDQKTIAPGESLELRAEIFNRGDEPVFVASEFEGPDNALTLLQLNVFLGKKLVERRRPLSAADYLRYRDDDPHKPPLDQLFPRYWVVLRPNHFYGSKIVMSPSAYEQLRMPGKYLIKGTYISAGFQNTGMNNPLASYADELQHMPYRAWTGEIETNSISIKVRAP
jgi:hypothetical protein